MTTSGSDPAASSHAATAGVPAKRLAGRQVVVVLGAAEPGVALLARALQALGVDMLDAGGDGAVEGEDAWRRPWVSDLNARMLAAIGRPADHFAHALPFPPGWWRRPQVQALKREAIAATEAALESHDDLWGFADLAAARLLPVWSDVFERLGVTPVYVWSLTNPSQAPAPSGVEPAQAAAAAEVRWLAYGADIFRYGGDHLAVVVDEEDWRSDPQPLIESLVQRLHLRWRGTRLDLYETVGGVLQDGFQAFAGEAPTRPAALPLTASFYRAAQAFDRDEGEARDRLQAVVDSAELLRPLIAPFLPALQAAGPTEAADDPAVLRQEIAALRESCAALKKAAQAQPIASTDADSPFLPADERVQALEQELDARRAEIRWLHDRHAADLREAEEEIEALRRNAAAATPSPPGAPPEDAGSSDLQAAQAEIARLQAEMTTLTNANERYLARIYELKKALEDHGAFERTGR